MTRNHIIQHYSNPFTQSRLLLSDCLDPLVGVTLPIPAAQRTLAAERMGLIIGLPIIRNPFLVPTLQTLQRDESTLRIATAQHLADLFDLDGA